MKNLIIGLALTTCAVLPGLAQSGAGSQPQAKVANGTLAGTAEASGVRSFKGIPFAAPPVGDLRWKEPQPAANWQGVRQATAFGPRAMQRPIFGDMGFRSNGVSEDCLYLNVWTPAKSAKEKLPVLVYYYGGGFMAGDGSEPRYDGESMAKQGIVAVTVNYRLNVFGFMAHPELTAESSHKASGNYGLLDQYAALKWVRDNVAAFGGDPKRIMIAGESAGSVSVSALMASPLSKDMLAGAIGESGSLLGTLSPVSLADGEKQGIAFAEQMGAKSLAELRAIPAEKILAATAQPNTPRFSVVVDGYFFPKSPLAIFESGQQAHVPLLVGWNSEEMNYRAMLGKEAPTVDNYTSAVKKMYPEQADALLKQYAVQSDSDVEPVATSLAGDRFIGFSTWKWSDLQSQTGGKPVYRYMYTRARPAMTEKMGDATPGLAGGVVKSNDPNAIKMPAAKGAVHSAEIEYAMGNLATNSVYAWTPDDYKVSETMQRYFADFIKMGNPNSKGLPDWPAVVPGKPASVMYIDVNTRAETEKNRDRYLLLDRFMLKQ